MKIEDVDNIFQVLNVNGVTLTEEDEETKFLVDSIDHLLVIYDSKPDEYKGLDSINKFYTNGKKEITHIKLDAEFDLEKLRKNIASKYHITTVGNMMLNQDGWYICAVYEGMDGLYPITFKSVKNGFKCIKHEEPLVKLDPKLFSEENKKNWGYNSIPYFVKIFNKSNENRFFAEGVLHLKIYNQDLANLKNVFTQYVNAQKNRIKIGNNIINMCFQSLGKEEYRSKKAKEALKKGIITEDEFNKMNSAVDDIDDDTLSAYKLNDQKTLDNIASDYKVIELKKEHTFLKPYRDKLLIAYWKDLDNKVKKTISVDLKEAVKEENEDDILKALGYAGLYELTNGDNMSLTQIIDLLKPALKREVVKFIEKNYIDMTKLTNETKEAVFNAVLKALGKKEMNNFWRDAKKVAPEIPMIKNEKEFIEGAYKTTFINDFASYTMYKDVYLKAHDIEDATSDMFKWMLPKFKIYRNFLVKIKGIGPVSAAFLIATYDPRQTVHASGFIKYTGMDQVTVRPDPETLEELDDSSAESAIKILFKELFLIDQRSEQAGIEIDEDNFNGTFAIELINSYDEYQTVKDVFDKFDSDMISSYKGFLDSQSDEFKAIVDKVHTNFIIDNIVAHDVDDETGESSYIPSIRKRARNKSDFTYTTYLNSDGKLSMKKSMGYNSKAKGRILGVICPTIIKVGGSDSYYRKIYDNYKNRIQNMPKNKLREKNGEKVPYHKMALRYVGQRLLEDFWIAYRMVEGLPLNGGTYAQGKLGIFHHNGIFDNLDKGYENSKDVPDEEKI